MLRKTDKSTFIDYLKDNSGLPEGYAREAVFPADTAEAAEFLKEVADKHKRVTISGAGTGVVGGRIPFGGMSAGKFLRYCFF